MHARVAQGLDAGFQFFDGHGQNSFVLFGDTQVEAPRGGAGTGVVYRLLWAGPGAVALDLRTLSYHSAMGRARVAAPLT